MRRILSTMLMVLASGALFAGEPSKPAATIGKMTVSQEELDQAVGSKLLRLHTEEYNIRRGVLEDLIATKLIDAEAARRHVTSEELLKAEVDAKIAVPTATEIEPIYDGVAERYPGMTKDQAMADIAESMRRKRVAVRRAEFIKELRDAAGVRVNLQVPRADVAATGPARGNANAPVTIVEFSDFECPFCGRAVETLQQIEKTYGDRVRIVFRDYPLIIHRTAKRAAEASHCADEQGKFWPMHDRLFSKGGPITDNDITRFALMEKLDQPAFENCLASGKYKDAWKPSADDGARVGVVSTPTFFVNGRMIVGAPPIEAFTRIIDDELANNAPPRPANAVTAKLTEH
jgi:protein-disulfide isomerase